MTVIGVTGHRFLDETTRLVDDIDQVLREIDRRLPQEAWSVISALAEGADRLVVNRVWALRPSARLLVPLPLPIEEYQLDFPAGASRQEFIALLRLADAVIPPPAGVSREEGYLAAGRYAVDHSDVLIALWDGLPPQGRGGTGEIVAYARHLARPVAWVPCRNLHPGVQQVGSPGILQGNVIFERF
jgi:hypothetical protein